MVRAGAGRVVEPGQRVRGRDLAGAAEVEVLVRVLGVASARGLGPDGAGGGGVQADVLFVVGRVEPPRAHGIAAAAVVVGGGCDGGGHVVLLDEGMVRAVAAPVGRVEGDIRVIGAGAARVRGVGAHVRVIGAVAARVGRVRGHVGVVASVAGAVRVGQAHVGVVRAVAGPVGRVGGHGGQAGVVALHDLVGQCLAVGGEFNDALCARGGRVDVLVNAGPVRELGGIVLVGNEHIADFDGLGEEGAGGRDGVGVAGGDPAG